MSEFSHFELVQINRALEKRIAELEALFKKYVERVGWNEGVDFLFVGEWTPEEWEMLKDVVPLWSRKHMDEQ